MKSILESVSSPSIRSSTKSILFQPEEIHFEQVQANKVFLTQLKLTNTLDATVQLNFRPSSADKLDVQPKIKKLSAKETSFVDVKLLMHRLPPLKRIGPTLIKQTISIKSNFFDQKVNVVIHLSQNPSQQERSKSRGLSNEPGLKVSSSLSFKSPSSQTAAKILTFGKQQQPTSSSLDNFSKTLQQSGRNKQNAFKDRSRISQMDSLAQSSTNLIMPDMHSSRAHDLKSTISDLQHRNRALNLQLQERERQIAQMTKERDQELQSARQKQYQKITQLCQELENERQISENLRQEVQTYFRYFQISNIQLSRKYEEDPSSCDPVIQIRELLRQKDPSLEKLIQISLQKERMQNQKKNEQIVQILKTKDESILEITQQLEAFQRNSVSINEQVQQLTTTVSQLNRQLNDKTQECKRLLVEVETIKLKETQIGQINELKSVSEKMENLRSNLAKSRAENTELESELQNLRREFQTLEGDYNRLKSNEEFVKQLGRRQKKLTEQHQNVIKIKDQTINELNMTLMQQNKQMVCSSDQIIQLTEQFAQLKQINNSDSQSQIKILYSNLLQENKRKTNEGEQLRSMIEKLTVSQNQAREEVRLIKNKAVQQSRMIQLERENSEMHHQINQLEAALQRVNQEYAETNSKLGEIQQLNFQLLNKEELTLRKDAFSQTTTSFTQLYQDSQELKRIHNQINELQQRNVKIEAAYSDANQQITGMKREKDKFSERNDMLVQRIQQLEQEKLSAVLQNEEGAYNISQSQIVQRLNERVGKMKEKESELQRQINDLQGKMVKQLKSFEKDKAEWEEDRLMLLKQDKNLSLKVVERVLAATSTNKRNYDTQPQSPHFGEQYSTGPPFSSLGSPKLMKKQINEPKFNENEIQMYVIQLREQLVQSQSAKMKCMDQIRYDRISFENKISVLERKLQSQIEINKKQSKRKVPPSTSSDGKIEQLFRCKAELEAAEMNEVRLKERVSQIEHEVKKERALVELVRNEKQDVLSAIIRRDRNFQLEAYLPREYEVQEKLAKKIGKQKQKVRRLESFLRSAKNEYDSLQQKFKYLELQKSQSVSASFPKTKKNSRVPDESLINQSSSLMIQTKQNQIKPTEMSLINASQAQSLIQTIEPAYRYESISTKEYQSKQRDNSPPDINNLLALDKQRLQLRVKQLQIHISKILSPKYSEALQTITNLREQFGSKLLQASQRHTQEYERLMNQNSEICNSNQRLTMQLQHMQKSNIRMHTATEEVRNRLEIEIRELRGMLTTVKNENFQNSKKAAEMELALKQSQSVANERSSQMQVLLETVETLQTTEISQLDLVQKYLNLSADLCSQKAIRSSVERKEAEMTSNLSSKQKRVMELEQELKVERGHVERQSREARDTYHQIQKLDKVVKNLEKKLIENKEKLSRSQMSHQKLNKEKQMLCEEIRAMQIKNESEVKQWETAISNQRKKSKDQMERLQKLLKQKHKVQGRADQTQESCKKSLHIQISNLMLLIYNNMKPDSVFNKEIFQELSKIILESDKIISQQQRKIIYHQEFSGQNSSSSQLNFTKHSKSLEKVVQENESLKNTVSRLIAHNASYSQSLIKVHEETHRKITESNEELSAALIKDQTIRIQLESTNQKMRNEIESLKRTLASIHSEFQSQVLLLKSTYEQQQQGSSIQSERQKLKSFYQNQLLRHILQSDSDVPKSTQLSCQIISLKMDNARLSDEVSLLTLSQSRLKQTREQLQQLFNQAKQKLESYQKKQTVSNCEEKLQRVRRSLQLMGDDLSNKKLDSLDIIQNKIFEKMLSQQAQQIENLKNKLAISSETGEDSRKSTSEQRMGQDGSKKELQETIKQKQSIIDALEAKVIQLRAQHLQELQLFQSDQELQLSQARAQLDKDYAELNARFKPGEAPGEIKRTKDLLEHRCRELQIELDRISNQNLLIVKKLESLQLQNQAMVDANQLQKQALGDIQMAVITGKQINLNSICPSPSLAGPIVQSMKKQPPTLKKKQNKREHSSDQNMAGRTTNKKEGDKFRSPKIVLALIDSKLSEAEAVRRVRKAGRNQIQLRQQINKVNVQKQDLQGKIRLLERTVKSHQIAESFNGGAPSGNNSMVSPVQLSENVGILKKRILQLEAQNQDLKLKESQNLLNYAPQARLSEQIISSQMQQTQAILKNNLTPNQFFNQMINGFILLLDQLFKKQIQRGHNQQNYSTTGGGGGIVTGLGSSIMSSQQSARQLGESGRIVPEIEKNIMVMSQLSVAQLKENDVQNPQIEYAQRVVIKVMIEKLRKFEQMMDPDSLNENEFKIPKAPSNQTDRQVWYLELLESEIENADREIKKLTEYTKKVQIQISGSLVSAAQIKAAAFELANQTNTAASEVEQLTHICKLVKNDVLGLRQNFGDIGNQSKLISVQECEPKQYHLQHNTASPYPENQLNQTPLPPQQLSPNTFTTPQTALQRLNTPQDMKKYIFELLNENQSLKNRVTLTDKVKTTIENDLVKLKLKSAQQTEQLRYKVQNMAKKLQSNKQQSADLHLNSESNILMLQEKERRILFLEGEIEKLKQHINQKTQQIQEIAKTKNVVAKQTTRLQNQMRNWKSNVQDKLNKKQIQVKEQSNKISSLNEEINTLQKRVSLLKRDKKSLQEKLNSNQAQSIKALNSQIQDLQSKLTNEIESRRGEVEFWVKQRAQLREKLDILEQENLNLKQEQQKCSNPNNLFHQHNTSRTSGPGISTVRQPKKDRSSSSHHHHPHRNTNQSDSDTSLTKSATIHQGKQIKKNAKKQKIKRLEKQIAEKGEQSIRLREEINRLLVQFQNREADYIQTQKQLESEASMRQMIAQRLNLLEQRTLQEQKKEDDSKSISQELSSLRNCFDDLKNERNKLAQQISHKNHEEVHNQQKTEEMIICMRDLNNQRTRYKSELDEINGKAQRLSDDNMNLRREMSRLEIEATQLRQENTKISLELQHVAINGKRVQNQCNSFQNKYGDADNKLMETRRELKNALLSHEEMLEGLRKQTKRLIEQSEKNAKLNQSHIELLRSRFITEIERASKSSSDVKRKSEATAQNLIQVTQKEAVIKQLRQELKTTKAKLASKDVHVPEKDIGSKKRECCNNNINTATKKGNNPDIILHPQFHKPSQAEIKAIGDKAKLLKQVSTIEIQLDQLKSKFYYLYQMLMIDEIIAKNIEIQLGRDKISSLEEHIAVIQNQKSQAAFKSKSLSKDISEINKQHKNENTRLREEITYLKEKWLSPENYKEIQAQKRELQAQLKTMKEQILRKKQLLSGLKNQDEQTRTETNALRHEIDQMKDDAEKIKRLTKETIRKDNTLRQIRIMLEAVRMSERKLLEQNAQLNDKIKGLRNDLARKDTIAKQLKDKMENSENELLQSKAQFQGTDRYKDQVRKQVQISLSFIFRQKLEIDRKDNQIQALKSKIEFLSSSVQKLSEQNKIGKTINAPASNELDKQSRRHEQARFKLRKVQGLAHSVLVFVRRLLRERVNEVKKLRQRAAAQNRAIQLTKKNRKNNAKKEFSQTMNRQYLKDGLDILDMSIDQLDDFVGSQMEQKNKSNINTDNGDLDALLCEMDEIVEEGAGCEFNGDDLFKAFEVLVDEKRMLEGQVSDLSRSQFGTSKFMMMGKENQQKPQQSGHNMKSSVEKYENYLQNLRKKEAKELRMKQF